MKHCPRPEEQDDLLRPRLVEMIDMRHELVKLGGLIDWEFFEDEWAGFFRKFALTKTQVRMAQAAMASRDTSVSELCKELGVKPVTLYRYVDPNGNLRDYGKRVLCA